MTWNPLDPNHATAPLVALLLIVGQLCTAWLAKPIADDFYISPLECLDMCYGIPKRYERNVCECHPWPTPPPEPKP